MNENYIIIIIAIVVIFFLVKFISKIFFRYILPLIITLGIVYYVYQQGII